MAAFDMLRADPTLDFTLSLTATQSFIRLTTAGALYVLMAVPMRRHCFVDERPACADGVAPGETLIVIDSHEPETARSARSMLGALGVSAATMLAATRYPHRIGETPGIAVNRFSAVGGFGVSLGWLSSGSGMIVGIRITASVFLGLVLSWITAPPLLARRGVIEETARKNDILLRVMWPATGMLVAGGLAALFLRRRILVKTFRTLSGAHADGEDLLLRWVAAGSALAVAALVVLQQVSLHMSVWSSLAAVVFTVPLWLVGLRVFGETDWGPISALSNLMEGVFGVVAPGNVQANMVASGVTGSIVSRSEGLMQVYKTAQMIGSTPKYMTWIQLATLPVGAAAVVYMYPLLRDTYGIGGETGLQSPISQKWGGFAKLLSQGFSALHPSAMTALALGSALGIVLTILEQNRRLRPWIPSPTGVGIGVLVPAGAVATVFRGAIADWIWRRTKATSAEFYSLPVASGFIADEALIAVVLPVLIAVGLLAP